MTDLTRAADMLWNSLQAYQVRKERPTRPAENRDHVLLDKAQTRRTLLTAPAFNWLFKNKAPASREALADALAADARWVAALEEVETAIAALDEMHEGQFRWIPLDEARPIENQKVLYFFEIVGTHPGRYAGTDEGMDLFVGLFGGFLGGDVTHWMPLPGFEINRAEEKAAA